MIIYLVLGIVPLVSLNSHTKPTGQIQFARKCGKAIAWDEADKIDGKEIAKALICQLLSLGFLPSACYTHLAL